MEGVSFAITYCRLWLAAPLKPLHPRPHGCGLAGLLPTLVGSPIEAGSSGQEEPCHRRLLPTLVGSPIEASQRRRKIRQTASAYCRLWLAAPLKLKVAQNAKMLTEILLPTLVGSPIEAVMLMGTWLRFGMYAYCRLWLAAPLKPHRS